MSHYLELLEKERVDLPVSEIRVGTLFLGNPKFPVGKLPAYSASMGEALYIRTPRGVASVAPNSGYDGQETMDGWVIEGFVPISDDVVQVAARFKRQSADLLFFAEQQHREIHELKKRIKELETPFPNSDY